MENVNYSEVIKAVNKFVSEQGKPNQEILLESKDWKLKLALNATKRINNCLFEVPVKL